MTGKGKARENGKLQGHRRGGGLIRRLRGHIRVNPKGGDPAPMRKEKTVDKKKIGGGK